MTIWYPWEIHNMGKNLPVMRKSLQPDLVAEALSFMPLNCFQNLTVITSPREGSHLLLVAEIQSARNCHCKAHLSSWLFVGFSGFFWLLVTHQRCVFADEVCSPLSTGSGENAQLDVGLSTGWLHGLMQWHFPFLGNEPPENWHIRFSIFEQFHVVYSPIPVPRRSVLPIACPYALFLISDFKYPLFLFLLLTFHLLCPTPLFLTACVLLNFHCLFKSRTMRNILQPFPVSSPSAAEVTKWLLAVHPASVTAWKDGKFSTGELPWVHPESSYCISAREWRDLRGGCWVCCCGSLGWFTNKNIEK